MSGGRRLVVAGAAISLTRTVVAYAMWESTGVLVPSTVAVEYPRLDEHATLPDRYRRLDTLRRPITDALACADLAVILAPAQSWHTAESATARHDWSGLWWAVVDVLAEQYGSTVAEVSHQAMAKYATGNGRSPVVAIRAAASRMYPEWVSGSQESTRPGAAYAVLLAAMGARHLGRPFDKVPALNLAGIGKVRWPQVEDVEG